MKHTMELPDQRIAYVDVGPEDPQGPPLLLLHGGAVDTRMWHPQLTAFPGRRVLAPDARGHGDSSDAEGPYRLVDDVVALLDALDIERAVAVGVSMGGGIACDLALEHPSRVAGIVVSGTGTSEPVFEDPWALQAFADWAASEQGTDLQEWIDVLQRFTAGPFRSLDEVDPPLRELVDTMARSTVANHLHTDAAGIPLPPPPPTPVTHTWQRLEEIEVPVLALSGALDGDDHRRNGRRLADSVPDGRYAEVPGAAHYPNLENPEVFDREVRELLRRSARAPA